MLHLESVLEPTNLMANEGWSVHIDIFYGKSSISVNYITWVYIIVLDHDAV